jgi:hypothetical protein
MSYESETEKYPREDWWYVAATMLISEPELRRLLNMGESLEEDFQLITLRDNESVEANAMARNLLRIWTSEDDRILVDKQVIDNDRQLQNWDNEGGLVKPAPSRHVVG